MRYTMTVSMMAHTAKIHASTCSSAVRKQTQYAFPIPEATTLAEAKAYVVAQVEDTGRKITVCPCAK